MARGMMVSQGFHPINDVGWDLAYWPAGNSFRSLGIANGGVVSTYPNEKTSGVNDMTAAGAARPIYRADIDGRGNPGLEFDGSDDVLSVDVANITSGGWRWYSIGRYRSTSGTRRHTHLSSGSSGWGMASSTWRARWLVDTAGSATDTLPHLFMAVGQANNYSLSDYPYLPVGRTLASSGAGGFPNLEIIRYGSAADGTGDADYNEMFTGIMFSNATPTNFNAFLEWAINRYGINKLPKWTGRSAGTGNGVSVSIAVPSTASAGDYLYAVTALSDALNDASAAPSGWTIVQQGENGGNQIRTVVWKKTTPWNGTDGPYVFTVGTNASATSAGHILSFRGLSTIAELVAAGDSGFSVVTAPALTSYAPDSIVVRIAGSQSSAGSAPSTVDGALTTTNTVSLSTAVDLVPSSTALSAAAWGSSSRWITFTMELAA